MSGPLHSSDVTSATNQAISQAQAIYGNLVRSNDYQMSQLASNFQYAHKQLLNEYNDRVNVTTQGLLSNIATLDATGELSTRL